MFYCCCFVIAVVFVVCDGGVGDIDFVAIVAVAVAVVVVVVVVAAAAVVLAGFGPTFLHHSFPISMIGKYVYHHHTNLYLYCVFFLFSFFINPNDCFTTIT